MPERFPKSRPRLRQPRRPPGRHARSQPNLIGPTSNGTASQVRRRPALVWPLIHRGAWKVNSRNFASTEFLEVHLTGEGSLAEAILPGASSSHAVARKKHPKASVPKGKGC